MTDFGDEFACSQFSEGIAEPLGNETMKGCTMTLKPAFAGVLSLLLMSCTAHGQQQLPERAALRELSHLPYWKAFRNHSSQDAAFFERLMFGRVFIYERRDLPNVVEGQLILDDGSILWCFFGRASRTYSLASYDLSFETHSTGAARTLRGRGKTHRSLVFYDRKTGTLREEYLASHEDPNKRYWRQNRSGWVQDSWPRFLAEVCPTAPLSTGMKINGKQTSSRFDELRRQDADAPIRDFPGSQHTGPGRTGLAASDGKPTTTLEEIEAWMKSQEGNVLVSSRGKVYVFAEGWGEGTEIWAIGFDGNTRAFGRITRKTDTSGQEWSISEIPGVGTVYYPIGYPLPLMSTGHRHPAWQITDWLIESGRVLEVPGLGEGWKGVRFHPDNRAEVFPADGGAPVTGGWRWSKSQLQVWLGDGWSALEHWQDLATRLNMGVKVWTPGTPNTGM